jgi:hypothetical protein
VFCGVNQPFELDLAVRVDPHGGAGAGEENVGLGVFAGPENGELAQGAAPKPFGRPFLIVAAAQGGPSFISFRGENVTTSMEYSQPARTDRMSAWAVSVRVADNRVADTADCPTD